ncbi:PH domain leucine-rich repeat protein phosphatase 1-like isoform X1 [Sycon ciliatum]|uniref:PH domain leucine-rich repeat protein phosphatase 1-like isoform X1 n=1 Tax=Sycon ciliatum TaxID=27933 RepID=UPI0031F6A839
MDGAGGGGGGSIGRRSTFSVFNPGSQLSIGSATSNGAGSAAQQGATGAAGPFIPTRRSSLSSSSGALAGRDARRMPVVSLRQEKTGSLKRGAGGSGAVGPLHIPKRIASTKRKSVSGSQKQPPGAVNRAFDAPYFGTAYANTAAALPSASSHGMSAGQAVYSRVVPREQRHSVIAELNGDAASAITPPDSGTTTPISSSASYPSTDDLLDAGDMRLFEQPGTAAALSNEDWLAQSPDRGFVRVHTSDGSYTGAERCTLETTAGELAERIGSKWLFVFNSSGMVRRLGGNERPLHIQVRKLTEMGYEGVRLQRRGLSAETDHCISFYDGKPVNYVREDQVYLPSLVRIKQKAWHSMWRRRYCCICGNRLFLYSNETGKGKPSKIEVLTNARAVQHRDKTHEHCLSLTVQVTADTPERSYLISFDSWSEHDQWMRLLPRLSQQREHEVDLSGCSLEALPDVLLYDDNVHILNLTRNYIRSRPIKPQNMHHQPATIRSLRAMKDLKHPFLHSSIESALPKSGWLDDLLRFRHLRSLTLADNCLETVPTVLYVIITLRELNLAVNDLKEIPPGIGALRGLQVLHLFSNKLSDLPRDLVQLQQLTTLSIGFNRFKVIPDVVHQLTRLRKFVIAGNSFGTSIWTDLGKIGNLEALDARLVPVMEAMQDAMLTTKLTYVDLDNTGIRSLYLPKAGVIASMNCCHNKLSTLPMFYPTLVSVLANCNRIEELRMSPKPTNLTRLLLSRNQLKEIPEDLCDLSKLQILDVSHNHLTKLPARIFWNMPCLRGVDASFNRLQSLPERIDNCQMARLNLHGNRIRELPIAFLMRANMLIALNLSSNLLTGLPPIGPAHEIYHMEELALTNNSLNEQCFATIAGYKKLKILHLAMNQIRQLPIKCIHELLELQELTVSRNLLTQLPIQSLAKLPKLERIMAHSNQITELGDFRKVRKLVRLDVSCNDLTTIDHVTSIISSLHGLDLSANRNLNLTTGVPTALKGLPRVVIEEIPNAEDYLAEVGRHVDYQGIPAHGLWTHGSAEASGNRGKHCAGQVKSQAFRNGREGLYGVFNSGQNVQIPHFLRQNLASIVLEEFTNQQQFGSGSKPLNYLKEAFLTAHSRLGPMVRKGGASLAICHIYCLSGATASSVAARRSGVLNYRLNVANVGHVQAVLSRAGSAMTLTQLHTTEDSAEERTRVTRVGGFITPEGKVNGLLSATRVIGTASLNPYIIPEPSLLSIELAAEDELLIIGCAGLWLHVTHQDAVAMARECSSASQAAKALRDLAQAYGSQGNISIVVVFFNQTMLSGRGRSSSGASYTESPRLR